MLVPFEVQSRVLSDGILAAVSVRREERLVFAAANSAFLTMDRMTVSPSFFGGMHPAQCPDE